MVSLQAYNVVSSEINKNKSFVKILKKGRAGIDPWGGTPARSGSHLLTTELILVPSKRLRQHLLEITLIFQKLLTDYMANSSIVLLIIAIGITSANFDSSGKRLFTR